MPAWWRTARIHAAAAARPFASSKPARTSMKSAFNLFVGPKTSRAIPVQDPLRRDFLVQAALDGCVRRIEYHSAMQVDDQILRLDGIIVDSDEGRHAVDFI